jgi:hypothetical protein
MCCGRTPKIGRTFAAFIFRVKMEAARHYNPESQDLNLHRCENIKSLKRIFNRKSNIQ